MDHITDTQNAFVKMFAQYKVVNEKYRKEDTARLMSKVERF